MIQVVSVENMKISDAKTIDSGISSIELMHRAASGVFEKVEWNGLIAIVVGGGNNGGDGFALATILIERGFDCHIYRVSDKLTVDSQYYYNLAKELGIAIFDFDEGVSFNSYDIVVDCIFAAGFSKQPREKARQAIIAINDAKFVISLDINSGLNGDSGIAVEAVKSHLTVSIGSYKAGHFLNDAKDHINKLVNVDIGVKLINRPYYLMQAKDFKDIFKCRQNNTHKGTYGKVVILGGSLRYAGAIKLAAASLASLCAGSGLSTLAVPKVIASSISSYIVESTIFPMPDDGCNMVFDEDCINQCLQGAQSLVIGMGWGESEENKKILEYILRNYDIPMVIDADGLNNLAKLNFDLIKHKNIVITPHLKEFSRLIGLGVDRIRENPIYYAKQFALQYNVTVLLKGVTTVITDGREVYLTNTGTPGMAKGGSGDVLSGIIAAINAFSKENILINAAAAAFINGKAGEYAAEEKNEYSMLASDTINNIYKAINLIIKSRDDDYGY